MQIWRHVGSKLLAELLIQATRAYAHHNDRRSQSSGEASEIADRPPG